MFHKIYDMNIPLRTLYDYVYFDFSKFSNVIAGADIFTNFLINKIGFYKTANHICHDYIENKGTVSATLISGDIVINETG